MITCREMVPVLRALLEHELPPEEAEAPAAHMAECPSCRALAGAYQATRTLAAELALAGPPAGWRERLRHALIDPPPVEPPAEAPPEPPTGPPTHPVRGRESR